jgi:hypothetical protein
MRFALCLGLLLLAAAAPARAETMVATPPFINAGNSASCLFSNPGTKLLSLTLDLVVDGEVKRTLQINVQSNASVQAAFPSSSGSFVMCRAHGRFNKANLRMMGFVESTSTVVPAS